MTGQPGQRALVTLMAVTTVLLAPVAARGALAAEATEPPTRSVLPDPELVEEILAEEAERETRVVGLSRARLSYLQRASGGIGAMWARVPSTYDCTTLCRFRGVRLQVEPGLTGGKIDVGWGMVVSEKRDNRHFLSEVYLGWGLKGSVLRTWGDSPLDPEEQTLVGMEADFTIIQVNVSLGVFRHVGGGDPDDPWTVNAGLGWGF